MRRPLRGDDPASVRLGRFSPMRRELRSVVRLWEYGDFYLLRDPRGPLFWTGLPFKDEWIQGEPPYEVVAHAEV